MPRILIGVAAAATLCLSAGVAAAQDAASWPSRSVRIIAPAAAGGTSDALARIVAEGLQKSLGQTFLVENIPGAASVTGTAALAKAAPDGYTFMINNITPLGIAPSLRTDMPYNAATDIVPVGQVSLQAQILGVNPKLPVSTVADLIKLLRDNPGKYSFGSSGVGQTNHLSAELFLQRSGTKMVHVPYKSSGEVALALTRGDVDVAIDTMTSMLPQVRGGNVKALAVTTAKRVPELPDVPAIRDTVENFGSVSTWLGIFAPAGTPQPILDKASHALAEVIRSPEASHKIRALGADPVATTAAELGKLVQQETATWANVIKTGNIRLQ